MKFNTKTIQQEHHDPVQGLLCHPYIKQLHLQNKSNNYWDYEYSRTANLQEQL
jgi:hypothetical protein